MTAIDPVQAVLAKLKGVKQTSPRQWEAKCPAHDDGKASLSIGRGDDGRALVFCHAGCALAEVLKKISLSDGDLFPLDPAGHTASRPARLPAMTESSKAKISGRIVKTYDYLDAAGTMAFQVVRFDPKDFRQRRPDGAGHWIWGLKAGAYSQSRHGDWYAVSDKTPADALRRQFTETPRVLYRLPELLAADKTAWVFLCEGEKDTDTLVGLGLVATTNPGGAGKWNKLDDDSVLHGRRVAILPDKDGPGFAHAQDVAARLNGKAAAVKIINLPDIPPKDDDKPRKDASDWIEWLDCRTSEELAAAMVDMADAAPPWTPTANAEPPHTPQDELAPILPAWKTMRQLIADHPALRQPVIHNLLREGETMNIIAQSKGRKSWLVGDLALSVATGRPWLGTFTTEPGNVLVLDNELHRETTAYRLPKIAEARGLSLEEWADRVFVDNLRGRLMTLHGLPRYFADVEPGRFKIIVLDALYRFWPPNTNENDNAAIAGCYNILDSIAGRLGCSFVVVHHTSKGSQSSKSLVDVGAGAGAIARAADAHAILLAHETDTRTTPAVVLDVAGRSFAPIEPVCLRFAWPIWIAAPDLDPSRLKPDRPHAPKKPPKDPADAGVPKPLTDEAAGFVTKYIGAEPKARAAIEDVAIRSGMSANGVKKLLARAESRGLIFRWVFGSSKPVQYATVEQAKLLLEDPK